MASLIKYKNYLLLLSFLILAKFVWVPLWETKQSAWQQLSQGQHNLAKMNALIDLAEPMKTRRDEVALQLAQAEVLMPKAENLTTYQLTAQAAIESLFKRYELSLDRTAWRNGIKEKDIQLLLLDLRFNGQLKNYLRLLEEFEINKDYINLIVVSDELTVRGQSKVSLGALDGQVTLQLAVVINEKPRGVE